MHTHSGGTVEERREEEPGEKDRRLKRTTKRDRGEKVHINERSKHREGRQSKEGTGRKDSSLVTVRHDPRS
jgi:hypothetical protein